MARRSTPQAQTDDRAFAVRLYFRIPKFGLGQIDNALRDWLDREIGRGSYAWHSGGASGGSDRVAIYFRHPAPALALVIAFPDLEIADDTTAPSYCSPALPFGRSAAEG